MNLDGGYACNDSLSGLHSWVRSARCGMVRLGHKYLLSWDCGFFV